MTMFHLRYDLRCPPFGQASSADLAAAALEQCAWADARGFASVVVSEHHGSPDGYLPSPLVMCGAIAARTKSVQIMLSALIAPLHDPIRLAEDLAVVDILSNGRVIPVLAAGYVESEFAAFGRTLRDRGPAMDEIIPFLEKAWTGEPFEYRGRTVRVTPRPVRQPRPPLFMGGSTRVAARRAARFADYYVASTPEAQEMYREECRKIGKPDPGPAAPSLGLFVHVAKDPDAAWRRIAPHALHETNAYGAWLAGAGMASPYAVVSDADELRRSGRYLVLTPEELALRARALGPMGSVVLHPLMGGLDPDLAWESLRLIESEVMPALR
ncbi:MAG: LLM class flavin-dependent oxidoreductase [Deltaproteobacteria bacterium]|nr:LLM class flavin-dependent oxidoreductase [Deltaproteobacteria bacterium]